MKTIEVTITCDGTTRVETKGFNGASCQQASRFLETIGQRKSEELTAEFHRVTCVDNRIRESN
jgi:hypothetical protein